MRPASHPHLRAVLLAVTAAALVASCGAFWRARERARKRALPALPAVAALSLAPAAAPGAPLAARAPCRIAEVARVGRRVTALLAASDGSRWAGTDGGVVVLGGDAAPGAAAALAGRRRAVTALIEHGGVVWAATKGGLVALDDDLPDTVVLADEAVTAVVRAGGSLYAATARGLFRVSEGGAEAVPVTGPAGEPLRPTALAVSPQSAAEPETPGGRLWIGTAAGAYALPLATLAAPLLERTAAWYEPAAGDPPADTNAVTALAAAGDAVLAGTEDGGLVRIGSGGEVAALRFDDARANAVSPGAAAPGAGGIVVGTAGGALFARAAGGRLEVARIAGLDAAVSAVAAAGDELLVGTADGVVWAVACGPAGGVG